MMVIQNKHQLRRETNRTALEAAAWRLFLRDGFADTTISDIAAGAGVSERTFFRHFESKEAVLFGSWRDDLDSLGRQIVHAPIGDPLLSVVRSVVVGLVVRYEGEKEQTLVRARLMAESDAVASYERKVIHRAWEDTIASAVAERTGVDSSKDLRPHLLGGMAVAAVHTAVIVWGKHPDLSLAQVVANAFDLLAQGGDFPTDTNT